MSSTCPIRESNAIDEIAFVLRFKKLFSGEEFIKDLIDLHLELKSTLPSYDITSGVTFHVSPQLNENIRPDKQLGIVCFKQSEHDSNRHEWALKVEADRIIVTCSEYTSWEEVSCKAAQYLSAAVAKVSLQNNPIVEVVYQCVDKIVRKNDDIVFEDAFSSDSIYLTPHIIESTPESWHIHQGWFESLDQVPARLLHNLNINVQHSQFFNEGLPQYKRHEAIVSHIVRIQNTGNVELELSTKEELLGNGSKSSYLDNVLRSAHEANKEVVRRLFSESMKEKIGL